MKKNKETRQAFLYLGGCLFMVLLSTILLTTYASHLFIGINALLVLAIFGFFAAYIIDVYFIKKGSMHEILAYQKEKGVLLIWVILSVNLWIFCFNHYILTDSKFYYLIVAGIAVNSFIIHMMGYRRLKQYHVLSYIITVYAVVMLGTTYHQPVIEFFTYIGTKELYLIFLVFSCLRYL